MPNFQYVAEYEVVYPFAEGGPVTATLGLVHEWPEAPDLRWVPTDVAPQPAPIAPVEITHEGVTVTVDTFPHVNEAEVS